MLERDRTVEDYFELLDEGTGLLLVGGQAVNLWAERYRDIEPSILDFQPFTSRDADFYRRVPRLRLPPNWIELPIPTKGRVRIVTHALQGPKGQIAEVIRTVNGLSAKELEDGSIPINYANRPMWFLVPHTLFQAKLANLKSIDQEGRQDLKHFQLLIPVTRCFFEDLLKQHTSTDRPLKVIAWMSQHATNVKEAIKLGHQAAAEWDTFFPIEAMSSHPSKAIRQFTAYQLSLRDNRP
jgi:hypothetical protein